MTFSRGRDDGGGGGRKPGPGGARLELDTVRERLRGSRGAHFWRSLDELAHSDEFVELLQREFPRQASAWPEDLSRRRFLQLMSASLALGGMTACTTQPLEKIVPYVEQPEQLVPGRPLVFATGMTLGGYATGLLAESHMGRPTKIEGNPEHPASLGATDLLAQASVLGLYDPDRSQAVKNLGRIRSWATFMRETQSAIDALNALGGVRLRILSQTVTSPTLARLIRELLELYPRSRWHQYDPVGRHAARAGSLAAFGSYVESRYDLTRAEVILALDADFLTSGPGSVRYARDFMSRRRAREGATSMSRLYVAESAPSSTGALADHRLRLGAREIASFALALAAELGVGGATTPDGFARGERARWVGAVARDLEGQRGRGAIIPGEYAPPAVHAFAHALNESLGNAGVTVLHSDPVEAEPTDQIASLTELVADARSGEVDILVILGGNPVYDAPADLAFAEALLQVPRRIRLGLYEDETSEYCDWHLPEAHYLESWGDARAYDGTVTLTQPLIEPLYGGKSALELVAVLRPDGESPGLDLLRGFWQQRLSDGEFETAWRRALHRGFIVGSELPPRAVATRPEAIREAVRALAEADQPGDLELIFRPDPTIYDGSLANNGWLQECPKPLTKLTWDNAAVIGPGLARELGVETEQLVRLEVDGRSLTAPVLVQPGQPERSVTLHLGYGRQRAGRIGTGAGVDAYSLRTSGNLWLASGIELAVAPGRYPLALTQLHHNIELEGEEAGKRHLVRVGSLEEYRHEPDFAQHMGHAPQAELSLYPEWHYEGYSWGMAVDLSACTGCNACVVACQAENNIPIVGKEQVQKGREMHWIRIDRYYEGGAEDPTVHHQPVMCMHCERAPCEVVCPVAATVHSDEGLNDMVYNRCVGTRYCSNNCPYKVRRFNFLKYNDDETPVLKMSRNPDVTVRVRGVMEKCTYCVQRINGARIEARTEGREIRDGEIRTACQQVCPTGAIVFGDINNPDSRVSVWKSSPLNYGILGELGTRPRSTYLARVRNPNPELEEI